MLSQIYLPDDLDDWKQILLSFPETCQDIYFRPEYLQMHAGGDSDRVVCLKYQDGEQIWIFPVLCNPILQIGNVLLPPGLFDLESAYGYGGPLSNSEDRDFIKRATQAFIDWAENSGIVAQFIRFHPLIGNERWVEDSQLEILFDRFTMSTDISRYDPSQPYYLKPTRNVINRGLRLGIEARLLNVDQEFPSFLELYLNAMERLKAEPYLFFDNLYFDRLRSLVKENGYLIGAFHQRQMIAAAIFFYGSCWLHYHLSASNFDNRLPGATNIILDSAFFEAKSKGLKRVHLGGGRTCDAKDPLLKFKSSMSTDMHRFYIGKRIYNTDVYLYLRKKWENYYPSLAPVYGNRLLCYRYER
jgi:hypothetical protein